MNLSASKLIIISFLVFLLLPVKAQLTDTISQHHYYQDEIFDGKYLDIYNDWILKNISGGFSGNGYDADFDRMKIDSIGIFRIYRNDSLFIYGKITIVDQSDEELVITFDADTISGGICFFDMYKYIKIVDSALDLNAPCCDRYNYHFTDRDQMVEIHDTIPPRITIISPVHDSLYFVNFTNPEVHVRVEDPNLKQSWLMFDMEGLCVPFGQEIRFILENIPSIGDGTIQVIAEDIYGNVAEDSVLFTWTHIDVEALAIPWNVATTHVSVDSILLEWNYNESDICINWCYLIYLDDVLVDTSFSTSYILTNCIPGTTYSVAVSAMANCYKGSYIRSEKSEVTLVTASYPTIAIGEHSTEIIGTVQIIPNPVYTKVDIRFDDTGGYLIQLFDLKGRCLFELDSIGPTHQIDLSSFQKGIYFITIRSRDFARTEKIIKLR